MRQIEWAATSEHDDEFEAMRAEEQAMADAGVAQADIDAIEWHSFEPYIGGGFFVALVPPAVEAWVLANTQPVDHEEDDEDDD